MKQKELKALAEKIAKAEQTLQNSVNPEEKKQARKDIIELSGRVNSLEDMVRVDEIIQKILKK